MLPVEGGIRFFVTFADILQQARASGAVFDIQLVMVDARTERPYNCI